MDGPVSDPVSDPVPVRIPVDGGDLVVADFGGSGVPVLAVHGITASSRAWPVLARLLPEARLLAPDLRGRARSNGLPGPFGLRRHAADLRRVLDTIGADRYVVVGHSMGAFAAVLLAADEPERVAELVLVDGGLPLAPLPGVDADPAALLGPVFERLGRVFATRDDYLDFWRASPAFAGAWTDDVAAYADYDLEPVAGGFRPSALPEAVAADQRELYGPRFFREALRSLQQPVTVLRAPLGLRAEPPGLYPPGALEAFRLDVPQLRIVEVESVNHYTVLMARPGADRVAGVVRAALERSTP